MSLPFPGLLPLLLLLLLLLPEPRGTWRRARPTGLYYRLNQRRRQTLPAHAPAVGGQGLTYLQPAHTHTHARTRQDTKVSGLIRSQSDTAQRGLQNGQTARRRLFLLLLLAFLNGRTAVTHSRRPGETGGGCQTAMHSGNHCRAECVARECKICTTAADPDLPHPPGGGGGTGPVVFTPGTPREARARLCRARGRACSLFSAVPASPQGGTLAKVLNASSPKRAPPVQTLATCLAARALWRPGGKLYIIGRSAKWKCRRSFVAKQRSSLKERIERTGTGTESK